METVLRNENQESTMLNTTTNEVLIEERKDKTIYYIPCYVRIKAEMVKALSPQNLSGMISGTVLFGFYYGNLPEKILKQFTGQSSKTILLQLPRQPSIQLREGTQVTSTHDKTNKTFDFAIRTEFQYMLQGDVFFTPFEIFNLHLSLKVQNIILDPEQNNGQNIEIRFNCMNNYESKIVDSGPKLNFGNYTPANYFLDADFTNEVCHRFRSISVIDPDNKIDRNKSDLEQKIEENVLKAAEHIESNITMLRSAENTVKRKTVENKQEEEGVKNYQFAHFRVPLYKYPFASMMETCLLLWMLALINIAIYFISCTALEARVGSVATVSLSIIAFMPTINAEIPQTNILKALQAILFLQIFTTFLTLVDSLQNRNETASIYEENLLKNPYLLITCIFNIFEVVGSFSLLFLHKVWWERVYRKKRALRTESKLCCQNWNNVECDFAFKEMMNSGRITLIGTQCETIKVGTKEQNS